MGKSFKERNREEYYGKSRSDKDPSSHSVENALEKGVWAEKHLGNQC